MSLAGLPHSQDAKKIPSKENLSSLKDALAHVVKKTEVSTAPTSAPKPNPLVEKPQEIKKEPAYPQKEQKTEHKPVDIKKDPVVTNMHEVPEDVLRDILKMDDSKVDFIRDEKQVNMSEEK